MRPRCTNCRQEFGTVIAPCTNDPTCDIEDQTENGTMAATKKSSRRRYPKAASKKVAATMRERKRGTLRSGGSGKKVTSRKQAIAIGLSEARRAGAKVPRKRSARKSSGQKRRAAR
jgi:hypothetical protein